TSTDLAAFEFCIVEPLHPNRLLTDIWRGAHFNGRIIPARQYQATSKICWALPQFLMAASGTAPMRPGRAFDTHQCPVRSGLLTASQLANSGRGQASGDGLRSFPALDDM